MNKIFISLITGLAIGIMIAPAKGSETRRKLVKRFNDFTEDLNEEADQIHASTKSLVTSVKDDVRDIASEIKSITEPI